jgi:hypothetical protein
MSLLPEREHQAVEGWFADLQEALGISKNADRGRVLASVRKLVSDNDSYNEEKRVVAQALGYNRWGDLYTWATEKLVAVPEVELPAVFDEPPNGWVFRPGGDYDKECKRLVKTRLRVKELWAFLDRLIETDPTSSEWAEDVKAQAIEEFKVSTDAEGYDRACLVIIRNYEEEEDTGEVWVEVAEEAKAVLELDSDLPIEVANELLSYAEKTGVEARRKIVEDFNNSYFPGGRWFNYLLAAYLYKNPRPERTQEDETHELFTEATGLLGCFELVNSNDPLRSKATKRSYDQSLTLEQITVAIRKVTELREEGLLTGTRDEWAEDVKTAVSAVTSEKGVTTTV